MDELEIGGKRYLSSRRAAKENKYHIDYIGQLIRAGKIVGKKVGRAWYVEEGSLHNYLAQENKETQIVVPAAEVITEMEQEIIKEEMQEAVSELKEVEPTAQKIHINIPPPPVQKLRNIIYVEDHGPMLPVLDHRTNADFISIPMRRNQVAEPEVENVHEEETEEIAPIQQVKISKKSYLRKIPALIIVAVLVLGFAALGSSFVASSITVTDGKPASAGFTIK